MDSIHDKQCARCRIWQPADQFYASKRSIDGLSYWCRTCLRTASRVRAQANRELHNKRGQQSRERAKQRERAPIDGKVCRTCKEWKPADQYSPFAASRDGLEYKCKACVAEIARKYYHRNPERSKAKTKAWRAANSDKNREWSQAYNKRYYAIHRTDIIAYQRKRYHEQLEFIRERRKDYRRTDKAQALRKAAHHRRRALKRQAEGSYTTQEWQALCAWFGNVCLCCGSADITVDHVVPLTRGGSNWIRNLQPLCMSCNTRKRDAIMDYRDPNQLEAFLKTL